MDTEYLLATQVARQELVLLHGWGSDREIWRPLLAVLRPWANVTLMNLPGCAPGLDDCDEPTLPELLAAVLARAPARAVYMGWSLGGKLALEAAAAHVDRVVAVVTLCSNPHFIADGAWPGMEHSAFTEFQSAYSAAPEAGMRRFASLQVQGARQPRELLRQVQNLRGSAPGAEIIAGLGWLGELDQRELIASLRQPQLHLLAERDGLVPVALAQPLTELLRGCLSARVGVLPASSHLAPLDCPRQVGSQTRDFLGAAGLLETPPQRDATPTKQEVSSSFSRAAQSYDSVAKLQREVGQNLLTRLGSGSRGAGVVLDLGCGTGFFRPDLNALYPAASYVGLDLAPGMVQYACAQSSGEGLWVIGDAESLPLAPTSVDVVFSSLAVQWCDCPERFFAELARVLAPGGRCVFTTLGPDTLRELRQSWASVDRHQHVNEFLPPQRLVAAAASIQGIELKLSTQRHCMHYQRVGELLAELKALGAHNMNPGRPAGLTSRKTLQGMLQAYESWRVDGFLPATYDVLFGEVKKV